MTPGTQRGRIALPALLLLCAVSLGGGCLCAFPGELLDPYTCERADDCIAPAACIEGFCVVPSDGGPVTDSGPNITDSMPGVDSNVMGTDSGPDSGPGTDSNLPPTDSGPCMPGMAYCDPDGHTLQTCDAVGSGPDPALAVECGLRCASAMCSYASNVPPTAMGACDGTAPTLSPPAGATVTYDGANIACSPNCGGTVSAIAVSPGATSADPGVACVSDVNIPSGVTVLGTPGVAGLILLVAGDVSIAGNISFDATAGAPLLNGEAGPGGGVGGLAPMLNSDPGGPGGGLGGGGGGARTAPSIEASGGAGGSYGGLGGDGGDADLSLAGLAAATYGSANLRPLLGGSGGGGGGDGMGGLGGGGGGGGGGALQITARGTITITGSITALGGTGGDGPLMTNHGAAGGGSGGAVLLEAPSVSVGGAGISVDGAPGGTSTGTGGAGGSAGTADGLAGMSTLALGGGAGGGGGGGGRVRVNADTGACTTVSPASACTSGGLLSTPGP